MNEEIFNRVAAALAEAGAAKDVFDLSEALEIGVEELQSALNELCAQGRAVVTKKGRYATPEQLGMITATASALRNGTPVACPAAGGPSLKLRARGLLRTLPGDTLLVRPTDNETCELSAIVQRGRAQLAAFLRVEEREARRPKGSRRRGRPAERLRTVSAIPCDRRIPYPILLSGEEDVPNDAIALIAIDRYPEGDRPMRGHILRILGNRGDMQARLKVIAEDHAFSTEFPSEVEAQCARLENAPDGFGGANREDLRGLTAFTIDGPFSKDFDDAVSLERLPDGWRLGVHIADVSHYVLPGSPIDREALRRGTSLYLPGLTVPMLPEILSNDLCSLMPDADRLALSLFMVVRDGKVVDHHLCRSVIHSHARLTYDAVNRLFDREDSGIDPSLHQTLRDMLALSREMRRRRFANGCIDFDMPEPEFVLDEENVPVDILAAPRGEAERLIEDFMLAANETIARLARTTSTPLIYRVHEDPDADRLHSLEQFLSTLNVRARIGAAPHPGVLQRILDSTQDHPSADTIRRMLLRSLQRARYCEQPLGHYALALEDYCHFTSPIRRYPDLVVHRMMKGLLDGENRASSMAELARQCSAREQEATLAEREADDLMKARYMQDRVGRKYLGIVTGVTSWGLYVTLDNTVEGLVHIITLDDYYEYDRERNQLVATGSRNVFRLGDRVRVQVDSVNLDRSEINFLLLPPRD